MSPRRIQWLGAGAVVIGLLAAWAHAQRSMPVDIVAPPAPSSVRLAAASEAAIPSRPSMPQLMPPSHLAPTEAILWQIREVCQLLKQPSVTMTEVANRLGNVTFEGEYMGMIVRPASRYFSEAQVFRDGDREDGPRHYETPESVSLKLTEPRQLPMSALESAFGKGKEYNIIDAPALRPMTFPWRTQPRGPLQCEISAYNDWQNTHGHKRGVAMEVTITRDAIQ